jgi:YjbE family integral membrane protein
LTWTEDFWFVVGQITEEPKRRQGQAHMTELIIPAHWNAVLATAWADMNAPGFWLGVVRITWIDLLLAGDNAIVIAMACRNLPRRQRMWGLVLGSGVAVLLRVVFALIIALLMNLPYVNLVGGLALLYVAVKLLKPEDHGDENVRSSERLWGAVSVIAIADVVMSLDNVIAIAAASRGHALLLIFGVAASVPLILVGAGWLMKLLERLPVLIWAGAALLGWIAGEVIAADPITKALLTQHYGSEALATAESGLALGCVALIFAAGLIARRLAGTDAA